MVCDVELEISGEADPDEQESPFKIRDPCVRESVYQNRNGNNDDFVKIDERLYTSESEARLGGPG